MGVNVTYHGTTFVTVVFHVHGVHRVVNVHAFHVFHGFVVTGAWGAYENARKREDEYLEISTRAISND